MSDKTDSTQSRFEPIPNERDEPVRFSHPAEEAFAQILDFYRIEWEYEPTTFPLKWNEKGSPAMAFAPDFYLVADDLYIELTTMKQRYVTEKNRKLRLLRELYPDVMCKLMYRKDVENLAVKYRMFEEGPLPRAGPASETEGSDETEEPQ